MKRRYPHLFLTLAFMLNLIVHAFVMHCHDQTCNSPVDAYEATSIGHDHRHDTLHAGMQDQDTDQGKDDGKFAKTDAHGWHSHGYGQADVANYAHVPTREHAAGIAWFNAAHDSLGHKPPIDPPSFA